MRFGMWRYCDGSDGYYKMKPLRAVYGIDDDKARLEFLIIGFV
jgi:hypothetical protein